jgi:hypothetical protein
MTLIRRGGSAAGVAFTMLAGVALFALPGCTPDTKQTDASPEVGRVRGEPSEPSEKAQQRLARALEDLLRPALPGARLSPSVPMPGETPAPGSAPLTVSGDRFGYLAIVSITDPAGRAVMFARIGAKSTEQECLSSASENVPATEPPAPPATDRRPDGTVLFGDEYLSKDDKKPSFIRAGAYLPDHTCVRFDLQNSDVSAESSTKPPTRKGGLPLGRTALADLAGHPSLTVFPPGFEDLK